MATDEERLQHLQLPLLLLEWLSGGLANGITSGLLNPMDVAKTRIQVSLNPVGTFTTLQRIYVKEGIRGMWMPGLSASFCREMLSSGPRAGFYVPVRNTIAKVLSSDDAVPSSSSSFIVKILAAITTGTLGSLIANPVDVVKIRLMNDPARYPSLLHALYRLGTEEGVQGLAKGVVPSVFRGAFIAAGELATYDQVKTTVKALFPDQRETATLHVLSSMVTGVVATTVAAPFDLLKTRYYFYSENIRGCEF